MTEAWNEGRRVGAAQLLELVSAMFRRCDMSEADALLLADTLVFADLSGIHSHGVLRVPEYAQKLTVNGVDPQGQPQVVRQMGACLVVDGNNSMGQIGCQFAMQKAIERAQEHGVGVAAVRGSNHCGAMAYFAMQALAVDMIGWATTNALPTMAPWGGTDRIVGINPLAVAIPAGTQFPILFDAAFSGSSHGKIRIHQQKNLPLPDGWALDADGQPTTDPARAIDGLLTPIGGFKGVSLAMLMGVFSSMLSGAAYGTELGNMEDGPTAGQDGHFLMAINVAAFEDVSQFKKRVDAAIAQIHESHKATGVERLFVAGEPECLRRQEYEAKGIPLNDITLQDIGVTARALGVDTGAFDWLQ
jgi:LDH2 family malate/lactate/ureidoglycolate dehydrogenase